MEVNGVSLGIFAGSKVLANGYGGADLIDLSDIDVDSTIVGGDGWDLLIGGMPQTPSSAATGGTPCLARTATTPSTAGDGWDLLDGGKGADDLIGGTGIDLFLYDNSDTLVDFHFPDLKKKAEGG